jgi:hypothetical protein
VDSIALRTSALVVPDGAQLHARARAPDTWGGTAQRAVGGVGGVVGRQDARPGGHDVQLVTGVGVAGLALVGVERTDGDGVVVGRRVGDTVAGAVVARGGDDEDAVVPRVVDGVLEGLGVPAAAEGHRDDVGPVVGRVVDGLGDRRRRAGALDAEDAAGGVEDLVGHHLRL